MSNKLADEKIHPEARTVTFRVNKWDAKVAQEYRVAYTQKFQGGKTQEAYSNGTIRQDPVAQDLLSVLDVSCNIHAAFPNTRILVGQPQTSVVVARADLARPTCDVIPSTHDTLASLSSKDVQDGRSAWEFVSLLRMMIQPYICDGLIDVAFAAEMAGLSTRTLQRKLNLSGSSYSQIVQEARFELACSHLDEPGMKVIDVAMMAGYESPQHFTRAFRRFTGVTPSQYRDQSLRKAPYTNRASV